ncbi:hypothetical protein [Agrobacterium sp. B1(2019)]|uniref:hypothetical protein n=1 Tax=Agrobacterium sp. B1(2019) TaxID=2607032 RepID=UPI0011F009AD|nr:hypothetical protein [Agrobacterium sp. B1(2019)]TZG36638.1 hypothetical protein AGR1_03830 [Agrobacterium sp. B1(2019)]
MNEILDVRWEDQEIEPISGGGTDKLLDLGSSIPVEGAWLVSTLDELVAFGEYKGVTMTAVEAILLVADKIEQNGVAPEGQKAVADLLRYLSQFALHRPIPMS